MILTDISNLLRSRGQMSLLDLSIHLDANPDAVRGMLDVLQRKGRVRKLPAGTACSGGCTRCAADTVEIYAWAASTA